VKRSVACILAATTAVALACSSPSRDASQQKQKLVVIGVDGLDPVLSARWIKEGKLPALGTLAASGGLHRLETTHNPDTAAAWATFATGVNPGVHRIFETAARDPATYAPRLELVTRQPGRFLFDYVPLKPADATARRGGTSFWVAAGRAGVRSSVLSVPLTFPPEEVPNGELLAGFPLPDIGGTMAAYQYFATDVPPGEEGRSETGGMIERLRFTGNRAEAALLGPADPLAHEDGTRELRVPFVLVWNYEARSVTIEIAGKTVHLLERQWSRWVDIEFTLNRLARLRGMAQFFLLSAGQHVRLYVSPIHWHPDDPPVRISSPSSFAPDLHDRLGTFQTVGWPASAWALEDGRLDEAAFLDDVERRLDDQTGIILNRIDTSGWDLLVGVIDAADHVQHVMWRLIDPGHPAYDAELARSYGNAIERIYRRIDEFVGELLGRLPPDATVMIVSPYGFTSYRTAVHLNSWLVERGYMTLRGLPAGRKGLHDLADGEGFFDHVDWSKTRAYAAGLGEVFVNLRGREAQGIVNAGAEYEQVVDALIIDLMNFLDPRTQSRVVASVYKRDEIYRGPYVHEAGDLLVTLERGYRVSRQTLLGGTPPSSIAPNLSKWSGDHVSFDRRIVPGVLISSRPIGTSNPRLIDIAPTVLKHFGIPVSEDLEGVPFY
jgi:predicted AlkP superfamily phosphohydrolase/phosphomutase